MYFTLFDFSWDDVQQGFSFITFSFGCGTERSVFSLGKYMDEVALEIVGKRVVFNV